MNIRGLAYFLFVLPIGAFHAKSVAKSVIKHAQTALYGERRERTPTTEDRRWEVKPIGVIESPYIEKFGTPKQSTISRNDGGAKEGVIRLYKGYEECLMGLEEFDYLWVITLMHLNNGYKTTIKVRIHIHIYVCVCVYIYVCKCVCMCVYVYVCVYGS